MPAMLSSSLTTRPAVGVVVRSCICEQLHAALRLHVRLVVFVVPIPRTRRRCGLANLLGRSGRAEPLMPHWIACSCFKVLSA